MNGSIAGLAAVLLLAAGHAGSLAAATPQAAAPADGVAARLKTRVSVDYAGAPLRRVLDDLGRRVGAPVEVDWKRLVAADILPALPVRLSFRDVPAAKVLGFVLNEARTPATALEWVDDRGVLLVTTGEGAAGATVTRPYDVARFAPAPEQVQVLGQLIQATVEPHTWGEYAGSTGTLRFDARRTMVVTATPRTHDALRAMLTAMAAPTRLPNLPPGLAETPAHRQALDRLARPMTDRQVEVPLPDVVAKLRAMGLNVYVDWRALETGGIERQATASVPPGSGDRALGRFLKGLSSPTLITAFDVDEDGIVTISTGEALVRRTVVTVYDGRPFGAPDEEKTEDFIKLISETVAPDTWREAGGTVGAIRPYGPVIVVTQTPENHRAIAKLIASRPGVGKP